MPLDLAFGKRVYDWLGEHPRIYRAIRWTAALGQERNLQELAIAATGIRKGDAVLDLACGAGANLPYLEKKVGAAGRIVAVDYSPGMLKTARAMASASGWTNIEFREADAATLDLPPNSLDAAICTFALSAMPGERIALQRVAAALKPGSRFVALDSKAFAGRARIFNPLTGTLFKYATNWDYRKDVVASIRAAFAEVRVSEFGGGAVFIAVACKGVAGTGCREHGCRGE